MSNEDVLCDALVRLLEDERGLTRSNVTYPERDRSGPPVDMRLHLGACTVAIEHTLIEPFPSAIQTGKEFVELTEELEAQFNGNLPRPGTYELVFPTHPTKGIHRREHERLREKIAKWIVEASEELHQECPARADKHTSPHGYRGSRCTEIDGIPLRLSLRVYWSERGTHDGAMFLARAAAEDLEELRAARIRTALTKKLPKLFDCAALGDQTFLILEWSDIALSNHILIARALETALEDYREWPDFIFLADTSSEPWYFFRPVIDGEFSIDMDYIGIAVRPAPEPKLTPEGSGTTSNGPHLALAITGVIVVVTVLGLLLSRSFLKR